MPATSISKEGWLTKQGHWFKNWKRRYFVLANGELSYFERADRTGLKGIILLDGCIAVNRASVTNCGGRSHGFFLTPASKKIFIIVADDSQTRDEWIAAVKQHLGRAVPDVSDAPAADALTTTTCSACGGDEAMEAAPEVAAVEEAVSDSGLVRVVGAFRGAASLKAWLSKHGVETEGWGSADGSKPVGALLSELTCGEAALLLDGTMPVRVLRVANVRVLSDNHRFVLMQMKEVLADGTVKNKRQPLATKLYAGEAVANAMTRGVADELGVSALIALPETQNEHVAAKSTSGAFPGLVSRYELVVLDATVAEGALSQTSFTTEYDGKRYYWAWHPRLALPAALGGKLIAHDYSALWDEKQSAHMHGTREWAFAEVLAWLDDPSAPQLLWYMGGGGTGKSVLSAELLGRVFDRAAAWHFCRHDDNEKSTPIALLKSLAAMLCHTLGGFEAALSQVPALNEPLESMDVKALFDMLIAKPIEQVTQPAKPMLIMIDALDEIPKEGQAPLLNLIAEHFAQLPNWLRFFVTSREEPLIKRYFSAFKPRELRTDETRNRADVEVKLRKIAFQHVKGEVSMADIEADVQRKFGIDMKGGMVALQGPMDKSREIYRAKRTVLEALPGFHDLLEFAEARPDATQASDDFATVFKQASEAQDILTKAVALQWEANPSNAFLKHAVKGTTTAEWIEMADSPGVKGERRAREKMANDYGGHANKLKDLARLTKSFTQPAKMAKALREQTSLGIKIVILKNKYANPTPMGYCDFNLVVAITLSDGTEYLCEVQLNLVQMLDAKREAHEHYEVIRTELPELCKASGVDTEMAGQLEEFIMGRLNNSALDAAVAALSSKADGLFLYADLLEKHLESEATAGREINFANLDNLPTGLADVYETNFLRAFGTDDGWQQAKPLVELILASTQPLTVVVAEALLNWDEAQKARVLDQTALLFPVREGCFTIFHKSVSDWLTGEVDAGGSIKERSEHFAVERKELHAIFAERRVDIARGGVAAEDAWRLRVVTVLVSAGLQAEWVKTVAAAACGANAAAVRLSLSQQTKPSADECAPLKLDGALGDDGAFAAVIGRQITDKIGIDDPFALGKTVHVLCNVGDCMSSLPGEIVAASKDELDCKIKGAQRIEKGVPRSKTFKIDSDAGAGALMRAASTLGVASLVEALVACGVSIHLADGEHLQPLHLAAKNGHASICKLLVEAGADPYFSDGTCSSADNLALTNGHVKCLHVFRPSPTDEDFTMVEALPSDLLEAAEQGSSCQVKAILAEGGHNVDGTCGKQVTALHLASRYNHPNTVEALLAGGAAIEATTTSGISPLMLAAEEACVGVVRTLCRSKASVTTVDNNERTPLSLAAASGNITVLELLLDAGAGADGGLNHFNKLGQTVLTVACSFGHAGAVDVLLKHKADPAIFHPELRASGRGTDTALLAACRANSTETVSRLLAAGVDANHRPPITEQMANLDPWSPLIEAACNGRDVIVATLLASKADPNLNLKGNAGPLYFAACNGYLESTRMLVEAGAEVDGADRSNGRNGLWWAATEGHAVICGYLVDVGANVNHHLHERAERAGTTPLYQASARGHHDTITMLLEKKADINVKEWKSGHTALHIAAIEGDEEAVRRLLASNPDCTIRNFEDKTAAEMAAAAGHVRVESVIKAQKLEDDNLEAAVKVPKGFKVGLSLIAPFVSHENGGGFKKPFVSHSEHYG